MVEAISLNAQPSAKKKLNQWECLRILISETELHVDDKQKWDRWNKSFFFNLIWKSLKQTASYKLKYLNRLSYTS